MIQFIFNRLVLFLLFWGINVSFVYATSLQNLLSEVQTQVDMKGSVKVNFFEHKSFKNLVARLPELKSEVQNMLDKNLLSTSDGYLLGHAAQYLTFNDFIYYQNLFVTMWSQERISNDVFSSLFFQSMNTSRRGFYLYRNDAFSQIIKNIVINQKNKKIEVIGDDFLSKWTSGQLMRQDIIRIRKNGFASGEFIDSEDYLDLGFIDRLSIKALKDFRWGGLLTLISFLISAVLAFFIKNGQKEVLFSGVFLSFVLNMVYLLFYQGLLLF